MKRKVPSPQIKSVSLIFAVGLLAVACGSSTRTVSQPMLGFPVLAPRSDADPMLRHLVLFHVPTKLAIERSPDTLSVGVDAESLETTNLLVGTNMEVGYGTRVKVYPEGERPPSAPDGEGWASGTHISGGTSFYHTKPDGLPLPGTRYVVEMDLFVFETDVPPQHFWSPQDKTYKVLWRRVLKQASD